MTDWACRICGNTVRGKTHSPSYCPRCSIGTFEAVGVSLASAQQRVSPIPLDPTPPRSKPVAPPAEVEHRRVTNTPAAPEPPPPCRPAKRIRPKDPLEVRLARITPLQALDISATGLLVEHARPFAPGSICEVELWRSSLGIRLRAEVVRSFVSGGGRGSQTGLRYRTAVHFLDTPRSIFMLLPELSEEA